jgi:hypothetical protein
MEGAYCVEHLEEGSNVGNAVLAGVVYIDGFLGKLIIYSHDRIELCTVILMELYFILYGRLHNGKLVFLLISAPGSI